MELRLNKRPKLSYGNSTNVTRQILITYPENFPCFFFNYCQFNFVNWLILAYLTSVWGQSIEITNGYESQYHQVKSKKVYNEHCLFDRISILFI